MTTTRTVRMRWWTVACVALNLALVLWWLNLFPFNLIFSPPQRSQAIHNAIARLPARLPYEPSDVEVLLFGNRDRYCPTIRSAIHTGYKHITLMGHGEVFPNREEALYMKVLMVRNYLATIPGDQVVVFIDSFDSILYATPSELLASWRRGLDRQNANGSILLGTERNLWPEEWIRPGFEAVKAPTPYAFPNSGVYMGRARDLLEALTRAAIYEERDDQLAWELVYVDNPGMVTLDYHADLVANMYLSCDDLALRPYAGATFEEVGKSENENEAKRTKAKAKAKTRPYNKVTDVFPSVMHFNGRSTGECGITEYQRTAWWDQADSTEERARQRGRELDFQLWSVSRTLYLSRLPFPTICS